MATPPMTCHPGGTPTRPLRANTSRGPLGRFQEPFRRIGRRHRAQLAHHQRHESSGQAEVTMGRRRNPQASLRRHSSSFRYRRSSAGMSHSLVLSMPTCLQSRSDPTICAARRDSKNTSHTQRMPSSSTPTRFFFESARVLKKLKIDHLLRGVTTP